MKVLSLKEVRPGMEVFVSMPGSPPIKNATVKDVVVEKTHGLQDVIKLLFHGVEGQRHTLIAGVEDFSRSNNQIFLTA
jgi:hypothetical protein